MSKFQKLRVAEVRQETEDCVSVAFELPDNQKEAFSFVQGQYLTLRTDINGEEVRRSYSICAGVDDAELRVAIKKVPGGKFSTYANEELREGDELEVMPPMGRFYTPVDPSQTKHYVGVAAGSGITPVISILKTVLLREPNSTFTLFYGNKNADTIIFREALESLKNRFLGRLSLHHVLSREHPGSPLLYGRIDRDKMERFCDLFSDVLDADEYFLCGPEQMIEAVRDTLTERGVDRKKVHFELFTTATNKPRPKRQRLVDESSSGETKVRIVLDGISTELDMSDSEDTILDAALKSGADLPYACKGGVCSTCRARVTQGSVDMVLNYALEADEVEAGFVLTCQCYPMSDEVEVNFDA